MGLEFDKAELDNIMEAFYKLTGIRIILFDDEYTEIAAYPKPSAEFCSFMKSHEKTNAQCHSCDVASFKKCAGTGKLELYVCHAGLTEASVPLKQNGVIIGYCMLGQVTDNRDRTLLYERVHSIAETYGFDEAALKKMSDKAKYKSREQIVAASKILEACTSYLILHETVTPKNDRIVNAAKKYIADNLEGLADISDICENVGVSRTRLYEAFSKQMGSGVSSYIKVQRLERARYMLKFTDKPISEIAQTVGFSDYNYFSKSYKAYFGKSPKCYRKLS